MSGYECFQVSSVDLVSGTRDVPVANLWPVLLVATIVAACLHPTSLGEWLNGLPVHPLVEAAIATAQQWQAWCEDLGLGVYFVQLRETVQALRELTW